ncbi:MAG: hypothetical protein KGZ87_06615 [Bacteroidetes bacterium]|nr:hypothetical protein [Bacteroidota bacterium]
MKNSILFSVLFLLANFSMIASDYSPYTKVGNSSLNKEVLSENIQNALKNKSFVVLGIYNPENNQNIEVISFTRTDIKNSVIKVKDRGALAAVLKIALVTKSGTTTISYTNPDYMFTAYLLDDVSKFNSLITKVSADLKDALSEFGNEFTEFGGKIEADKLKKYHYKIMMPYFTDPVTLREFKSFEEGLKVIESNLNRKKGNTKQVYKLIYTTEKVAVFGVGLENKEKGEAKFLPIIGQHHAAALPYEMILQDNKLTMLHGKYRIALYWPELTMGTFMKIMSTPGDIEDTLKMLAF